jgi:hypothetical protein
VGSGIGSRFTSLAAALRVERINNPAPSLKVSFKLCISRKCASAPLDDDPVVVCPLFGPPPTAA